VAAERKEGGRGVTECEFGRREEAKFVCDSLGVQKKDMDDAEDAGMCPGLVK
jgi:hypothetical protein